MLDCWVVGELASVCWKRLSHSCDSFGAAFVFVFAFFLPAGCMFKFLFVFEVDDVPAAFLRLATANGRSRA